MPYLGVAELPSPPATLQSSHSGDLQRRYEALKPAEVDIQDDLALRFAALKRK